MILIADSGSTKCDWKIVDTGKEMDIEKISTMGFNPFFHTEEHMYKEMEASDGLSKYAREIKAIHYFGAGCSSPERNAIVKRALTQFFPNADNVHVEHDLLGAALATCGDQPGIACILGTGSNAGYFDGNELHDEVHALGYILGDEGSGCYMGKKLVIDYLYHKLHSQIEEELEKTYGVNKEVIFENVYKKAFPNVYLASFARFLSNHRDYYYVRKLVRKSMLEFLDIHVCRFDMYDKIPAHFVGSIGFYFEDILREVATQKGVQVGQVIKQPIHNLVNYYRNEMYSQS